MIEKSAGVWVLLARLLTASAIAARASTFARSTRFTAAMPITERSSENSNRMIRLSASHPSAYVVAVPGDFPTTSVPKMSGTMID